MRVGRCVWLAIALLLAPICANAESRVALVIGNSNYTHVPRLVNPANDSLSVAAALRRVGFNVVDVRHDLAKGALEAALQNFTRVASGADIAIVYYAGHGMEMGGSNYLVPVDARLASDNDVAFEAVPLDLVMRAVDGAHRLKIVILDACRNNPFLHSMSRASGTRAISRGLARIEPQGDTLVAYAAKEGSTADDGASGNSPFATALTREIVTPGLEIRLLFGRVRDDVLAATSRRQEPAIYGSLGGSEFYLVAPRSGGPAAPAIDANAMEVSFWNAAATSNDPAQLRAYLAQYPHGTFVSLAQARLDALRKPAQMASLPPAKGGNGFVSHDPMANTYGNSIVTTSRKTGRSSKLMFDADGNYTAAAAGTDGKTLEYSGRWAVKDNGTLLCLTAQVPNAPAESCSAVSQHRVGDRWVVSSSADIFDVVLQPGR